ncbi:class I heat shock protein, putative [Actinidia rufa]|uniref:Class I heat shock protein, putative n=1 Tax=Actinidia rufa TaxID=165716 RepID=A0A7J0DC82_9ERIC|nr:class I heat shock protein, putative [Actinidia rufa]
MVILVKEENPSPDGVCGGESSQTHLPNPISEKNQENPDERIDFPEMGIDFSRESEMGYDDFESKPSKTGDYVSLDLILSHLSSCSHPFSDNPSFSLTCDDTTESYEYSVGSCGRDCEQIWNGGQGTNGSVDSQFRHGVAMSNQGGGGFPSMQGNHAINKDSYNRLYLTTSSNNHSFFPSTLQASENVRCVESLDGGRARKLSRQEGIIREVVSESIPVTLQCIQELPDEALEPMKKYLKKLIATPERKEELTLAFGLAVMSIPIGAMLRVALQGNLIKPGPGLDGPSGTTEMQFHCLGCGHASEMFGFVNDVFMSFAKDWDLETLMKELDCVREIFRGSEDYKGKKLHVMADRMLSKLESPILALNSLSLNTSVPNTSSSNGRRALHQSDTFLMGDNVIEDDMWAAVLSKEYGFDNLESFVRFKEAEARMYQPRADKARRESENYSRMVQMESDRLEEEYAKKLTKLGLKGSIPIGNTVLTGFSL